MLLGHALALGVPSPHASAALAGQERASGWTLDPRVYEKPGQFTGCPDGQRNAAESECLAAVQAATTALGLAFEGHTFKVVDAGADGWVPSGCSYSRGHGLQAVFNQNPAGRNWRSYPLACIDVVQATAAEPGPEPAPVKSEAVSAQPIPANPNGWSLDPRVYEEPGQFTGCPDGQRNADESECLAAAQEATAALGLAFEGHVVKVVDEGADGWVPSGCSYSRKNGLHAIFNRNPAGRNRRSYPLVCTEGSGVPDFAMASGSLADLFGERLPSQFVCLHKEPPDGRFLLQGHAWMVPPPNTHLLLFGTSHFYSISEALRAALAKGGYLQRTEVLSHASSCAAAPAEFELHCCGKPPAHTLTADEFLAGSCDTADPDCEQRCGVFQSPCINQQGVVVDYLAGGSTITTIQNHAQMQRSDNAARLDELLSKLPWNLTHAAFMRPHDDVYFAAQCKKSSTGVEPDRTKVGDAVEACGPYADGECPKQSPTYRVLAKHVRGGASRIATVLRPDVDALEAMARRLTETRRAQHQSPAGRRQRLSSVGDGPLGLRCVFDKQIASTACAGRRNTTAWITQALQLYSGVSNGHNISDCIGSQSHLCNAICSRTDTAGVHGGGGGIRGGGVRCQEGPGLAAVWLVLRAAGLAASSDSDRWDAGYG
eukprot:scaffold21453_cov77-Phaeocystis_antarctica.AAC.1